MKTLEKIENYYKENGFITYLAICEDHQLLLFHESTNKSKIYGIKLSYEDESVSIGCFERMEYFEMIYGGIIALLFRDFSDHYDYEAIISKIKQLDIEITDEINTNSVEISYYFFNDPGYIAKTYLKNNGYKLLS